VDFDRAGRNDYLFLACLKFKRLGADFVTRFGLIVVLVSGD
jgi:hypothetical protein